jgi:hypothetical protein
VLDREGGEGGHVGGRTFEQFRRLREACLELLDDATQLGGDLLG